MAERTLTIHLSARSVVTTLAIAAVAWAAWQIPDVLTMVLVALIIASAMYPGVSWLTKHKGWPRAAAIAAMFGLVFGVVALMGVVVVPTMVDQAQQLAHDLPAYTAKLKETYAWILGLDARFHMLPDLDDAAKTVSGFAAGWVASTLGWATKLLGGVATFFLVMIITFFILLDGPELGRGALRLVPPDSRELIGAQIEPVAFKLGAYVQGVLISIGFLVTYLGICLSVAGMPMALALALLAGFFELIPLVGSLLGAIPAVLVALTVSWKMALVVVAIFGVGNVIQGNVVAPFVFSRSVEVSPVMILLALLVGANLFGVAGAIIAVPLMAMIQVLVQNLYVEPMERRFAAEQAPPPAPLPEPVLLAPPSEGP